VIEQELNLFEFVTGTVTEPSTRTAKVMRRQVMHPDPLGIFLY
jgi:hypothetical protein